MGEKRRPTAVSDILETVFRGHPLERRIREGGVWLVWDDAVGEQISSKAQPAKLNEGVLTVHVSSAPWLQQLTFLKEEIRKKVNDRLGQEIVKEIFLKAGRLPKRETAPAATRRPRPATPDDKERVATHISDITDADLRSSLESLFLRNLETKQ